MLRLLTCPRLSARLSVIAAFAVFLGMMSSASGAAAAPLGATSPSLGAAANFAILAGSTITNIPTSSITGDIGLSPGSAIVGFTCLQVNGTIYTTTSAPPGINGCHVINPGLLTTAKNDLGNAYDGLAAGPNAACTTDYGAAAKDLAGLNLGPGVYCVGAGGFKLTGVLTLTGSGVWIFRSKTTIITSPGSKVTGGDPCNVWWRAATSVTLDTTTSFLGNILALASIGMNTGATLNGRALARNAAVTLDSNTITRPNCAIVLTNTPTNTPPPTIPPERDATNTPVPSAPTATNTPTITPGGPTLTPTPTITPGGPTLTPTPTITPGGPTLTQTVPLILPNTGAGDGRDATVPVVTGLAGLAALAGYLRLRGRTRPGR